MYGLHVKYSYCFLGKRRRKKGGFLGSNVILDQLTNGVDKMRVGLTSKGAILRQDCGIIDNTGVLIGHVTSGCPSPTLGCNIAMAYVQSHKIKMDSQVDAQVRNRVVAAKLTKLPFVPCTYYKK